ncbi:MAG: zinc-dependent alcohol dehydrogenase family protein [Eubacteriales bacterium]
MKKVVFYGKQDMRIEESNMPSVGAKDVLIQVKACGICGTDVHIYEGDKGSADVEQPTVLGHEYSGIITEVGSEVTKYKVGDRVCVDPNCYCGACEPCRDGRVHYCEDMLIYGVTVDGGFQEYCSVNEKAVYLLGDNTSYEQGAMVEPLGCCLHGMDMCEITAGSRVVVIGGGMIGLIMMQLAKLAGASKVALLEPVEAKRNVALEMGADVAINPIGTDVKAELKKAGFRSVNTVIECVGRTQTIEQAIDIAGNKAVVMMFGLTKPEEVVGIKPFEIFKKELVLKASFINPCTQQRALDLIDAGRIDVSSMIYGKGSLEDLEEVLRKPELRANGKYLICPEN